MSRRQNKLSKHSLKETAYRFLFEQEEEEDPFAGDEGGEEDDAAEDAPEDDAAAEDAPEEETDEAEEVEVTDAEKYELSDSIDNELDSLLVDFEEEARKSAAINVEEDVFEETYRRLFEGPAADIDLRSFASNIARLLKNYQNLIDWESVILNKVESFVNNHYGEETAIVLFDILESEFDIAKKEKQEEPPEPPHAAGASAEAASAA